MSIVDRFWVNGGGVGEPNVRVVTAAGAVTVLDTDDIIIINKTVGAATTVNLLNTGRIIYIKDGKGDAASNNITLVPPSGLIESGASAILNSNNQAMSVAFDGTNWWIV